jgi:hypothetical protein
MIRASANSESRLRLLARFQRCITRHVKWAEELDVRVLRTLAGEVASGCSGFGGSENDAVSDCGSVADGGEDTGGKHDTVD